MKKSDYKVGDRYRSKVTDGVVVELALYDGRKKEGPAYYSCGHQERIAFTRKDRTYIQTLPLREFLNTFEKI